VVGGTFQILNTKWYPIVVSQNCFNASERNTEIQKQYVPSNVENTNEARIILFFPENNGMSVN
jgi:hypothetical protein